MPPASSNEASNVSVVQHPHSWQIHMAQPGVVQPSRVAQYVQRDPPAPVQEQRSSYQTAKEVDVPLRPVGSPMAADMMTAGIASTVVHHHAAAPVPSPPAAALGAAEIKADWHVPNVQLMFKGEQTTLHQLLTNKKGIIFGVPGAFTPVCSQKHVPGFRNALSYLKEAVDFVACVAVNDPCVLKAWAKELRIPRDIVLIADWDCKFTKALGLELDASSFHMGTRCRRFCILVSEGTIVWFGLEGDAFVDKVAIILNHLGLMSSESLDRVRQIAQQIEDEAAARQQQQHQLYQQQQVDEKFNERDSVPKIREMSPVHEGEEPPLSTDEYEAEDPKQRTIHGIAAAIRGQVARAKDFASCGHDDGRKGEMTGANGLPSVEMETAGHHEEMMSSVEETEEDIGATEEASGGEEQDEVGDEEDEEYEFEEEVDQETEIQDGESEGIMEQQASVLADEIDDEVPYIDDDRDVEEEDENY